MHALAICALPYFCDACFSKLFNPQATASATDPFLHMMIRRSDSVKLSGWNCSPYHTIVRVHFFMDLIDVTFSLHGLSQISDIVGTAPQPSARRGKSGFDFPLQRATSVDIIAFS